MACNVIRIAPGLARPVDTIVDVFKLFISADIVDLIVEHSNSKANDKRLSKSGIGTIQTIIDKTMGGYNSHGILWMASVV